MSLRSRFFLIALSTVLLWGCGPDEEVAPVEPPPPTTGTLRLVIVPQWQGGPFAINEVYNNVSNYRVRFQGIKFYLGDIRMLTGTTSTTVKDIVYFDLHNGSAAAQWAVEPGTWSGMRMGLGVPQELNDADPIVYPPMHPLDLANGTYWNWANAYRFLQFDGYYDLDGSGTEPFTTGFSIHTGLNACYREFDLDLGSEVSISTGQTTTITLNLAVDRMFYSATDTLDLATENESHGGNLPLALKLTDNTVGSLSVQ